MGCATWKCLPSTTLLPAASLLRRRHHRRHYHRWVMKTAGASLAWEEELQEEEEEEMYKLKATMCDDYGINYETSKKLNRPEKIRYRDISGLFHEPDQS